MQPLLLSLLLACLLAPMAEAGEIIGGHEAIPHSRPYMAFLWISGQKSESWFGDKFQPFHNKRRVCGGFLIREDFVLTAAHCKGSSITVILGAHDITMQERTQQVIPVKRAIPHPDYNLWTKANDIMLLQLQGNATLNTNVKTIRLPKKKKSVKSGKLCTVAGWGHSGVNTQLAHKLQEVDLAVQKNSVCLRFIKDIPYDNSIQICAGEPETTKSTFEGDSGGPLVCKEVAQGIISYGSQDGTPPCVFTRISSFVPWVEETMRQPPPHLTPDPGPSAPGPPRKSGFAGAGSLSPGPPARRAPGRRAALSGRTRKSQASPREPQDPLPVCPEPPEPAPQPPHGRPGRQDPAQTGTRPPKASGRSEGRGSSLRPPDPAPRGTVHPPGAPRTDLARLRAGLG
ncbi:mast cell protease 3-like [Talpa occidentalis]|uniref:mast cell protease 3-like n=1 Tax=Talpa occidentalis TaxID=50954 RepID=UPI0023F78F47|nr:mast cell protease 3-like [Talpa occidentalis]